MIAAMHAYAHQHKNDAYARQHKNDAYARQHKNDAYARLHKNDACARLHKNDAYARLHKNDAQLPYARSFLFVRAEALQKLRESHERGKPTAIFSKRRKIDPL